MPQSSGQKAKIVTTNGCGTPPGSDSLANMLASSRCILARCSSLKLARCRGIFTATCTQSPSGN
eukprot:3378240-Amphidinium_carterae.1